MSYDFFPKSFIIHLLRIRILAYTNIPQLYLRKLVMIPEII